MENKPSPADFNPVAALARARRILAERFGHTQFRPGQEEPLQSILAGRNLLVVMPTGSGKSLLYQLSALLADGITLVVSPLIALMKDQVDELGRKGIPATFVNSSLSQNEQRSRLEACGRGEFPLLYVAPERFRSAEFLAWLRRIKVSRMAVDEAHCISQWGHDFRPDYLRLQRFREQLGRPPVTALTATATPRVQQDIIESLGLKPGEVDVHVHGFDRPNLALQVVPASTEAEKLDFLAEFLARSPGAGILYTGTRKVAEKVAAALHAVEPRLGVYHAGMEAEDRTRAQEAFLSGRDRVVVATNAFGMGIDKPDVRFVVHFHYPGSVEQYYQEIGRAGRDGIPSSCVLLYSPQDHWLREYFIDLNYPGPELVEQVYRALWEIPDNPVMLTYAQIAGRCPDKVKEGQVGAAIKLFDRAGVSRAFSGEPTIAVTLGRPGAELLAGLRGPVQRRVLEALSASADLETPGRFEVSLAELSRDSGLSEEQLRRALSALDREGAIGYEPAFRGRGVEKLVDPPPPFDQVPIDWENQQRRRQMEEAKLAAMESYIRTRGCRREFVLHYFGEQVKLRCGTCDRCVPAAPRPGPSVLETDPAIARAVLVAVLHLRFPLGKGKLARLLTGAPDAGVFAEGVDENPADGTVSASRTEVKEVIQALLGEGYLEKAGAPDRPVLALTELGQQAALAAEAKAGPAPPLRAVSPAADPGRPGSRTVTDPEIELEVLQCVAELRAPLGATKIAEILAGSRAKWVVPSGVDRLEAYGRVAAPQERIREVIGGMLKQKLLGKSGDPRYPVLRLSETGQARIEQSRSAPPPRPVAPPLPPAPDPEAAPPAGGEDLLERLLRAEPEEAKALLPALRELHPRGLAERLGRRFEQSQSSRVQARAVWAAGELCGRYGLAFLLRAAVSPTDNLRRLAASALGKAATSIRAESKTLEAELAQARQVLSRLTRDSAPQVRESAEKSLRLLIPDETD